MDKKIISVISPVYKAEKLVDTLVDQIIEAVSQITENFEIILINDDSPDNSWKSIEKNCLKDKRVKGINLSRNFGQHYAITAGLSYAEGEWIIVMDCDLQDNPEEIINLYKKAQSGYDIVLAQRVEREDSFFKKLSSHLFYSLLSYLTETHQDKTVANFGIYNRKVIRAILEMKDSIRYFPTMVQWVGFNKVYMPVKHQQRIIGKSSYTISALVRLAMNNILSFSSKPLLLIVKFGFFISAISFLIGMFFIFKYLTGEIQVLGFSSLIISLWFIGGVIISLIGIVGLYVGRVFDKVKDRPIFIVNNKLNFEE